MEINKSKRKKRGLGSKKVWRTSKEARVNDEKKIKGLI
jgi:hypothetical protein